MKPRALIFIFLMFMVSVAYAQSTLASSPAELLHNALAAMGGEQKIRDLKTIHMTMLGHRNFLEQSERPEGPYIVEYEEIDEWRDWSTAIGSRKCIAAMFWRNRL